MNVEQVFDTIWNKTQEDMRQSIRALDNMALIESMDSANEINDLIANFLAIVDREVQKRGL